jgi:hypothetical protein
MRPEISGFSVPPLHGFRKKKGSILSWIGYAPLSSCSAPFNLPNRLVLLQPRCLVHNSASTCFASSTTAPAHALHPPQQRQHTLCILHNSASTRFASSLPSKIDDDLLWWTTVTRMITKHPHSYVAALQKIQNNV